MSFFFYIPDETVSTLRGQSVVLTCPIDITSCGDLHSVKWFKGNDRVAVVSGDGDVSNVEGQFTGRYVFINILFTSTTTVKMMCSLKIVYDCHRMMR